MSADEKVICDLTAHQSIFTAVYKESLTRAVKEFPAEYGFPIDNVPIVVQRMMKALNAGTFNHDGRAFKMSCKILSIPYTRKAILEYWNS